MRARLALVLLLLTCLPAAAAPSRTMDLSSGPYRLHVFLLFPTGAGRETEARCTDLQRAALHDRFQRLIDFWATDHDKTHRPASARDHMLVIERMVSCGPDGGLTLSPARPEETTPTEHFEPHAGWQIVG